METATLEKICYGYGWHVKSIIEIKEQAVYRIETPQGFRCLKRISHVDSNRLLFIYGMMVHLKENGFIKLPAFIPAKKGKLFVKHGDNLYYAMTWIEGRKADFTRPYDIQGSARTLAGLHKACHYFEPPKGANVREMWGVWPKKFKRDAKQLLLMKKIACNQKKPNNFDEIFLENVDVFYKQALQAIQMLAKTEYDALVALGKTQKFICHHDYTYHNLLINAHDDIYVIDFDLGCYEIRAYDIADFIRRVSRQNHWDIFWTECILKNYHEINPLSENELPVILALIQFPQLFWRTARDYYFKYQKGKEETYLNNLQFAVSQVKEKEVYIDAFKKEIGFF